MSIKRDARKILDGALSYRVYVCEPLIRLLDRGYLELRYVRDPLHPCICIAATEKGREYLEKLALAHEKLERRKRFWLRQLRRLPFKFETFRYNRDRLTFVFSMGPCRIVCSCTALVVSVDFWYGQLYIPLTDRRVRLCIRKALEALPLIVKLKCKLDAGAQFRRFRRQAQEG